MKILLVEDDPDIARALLSRLRRDGHRVAHAPDAISAVSCARAHAPDLVLLDLGLPGGGGLLVAERLAQAPETQAARIVVITGSTCPQVAADVASRGYRMMTKPFSLTDLRGVLDE